MQLFDENFPALVKSHWEKYPYLAELVFIDLETTGLSPLIHEVIEIGCIKVSNKGDLQVFHSLIKPRGQISPENFKIHGINEDMLKDAPTLGEIFPKFLEFVGNAPIVGHNIQFDCGFLLAHAASVKSSFAQNTVVDTCLFSRQVAKHTKDHPKNHKLITLADIYNIQDQHHRALSDSLMCLKIFMRLMEKIDAKDSFEQLFWKKSLVYQLPALMDVSFADIKLPGMCDKDSELLKNALSNGKKLMISYDGGTHGDHFRPIKPVALLPMPKGMVLHAECLLTQLMKNFKLNKIKALSSI